MILEELRQRLAVLNERSQAIAAKATDEKRDLTTEEAAELDSTLGSFDRTKADIDRLEKLGQQSELLLTGTGRKTQADNPASLTGDGQGDVQITRGVEVGALKYVNPSPNWNFHSLGDFAMSVRRASIKGGQIDRRLELSEKLAAATTYGNEGSGADGGFAVPPEFRTAIMVLLQGEDSLLARCDQVTCAGNNFTQPVDETTPWQTSGGILANWDGEAAAATQSKPALTERTVKLNKLRILVPLTEEIMEDVAAMDSYLRKKAPQKILFKINNALINGNGVGQPYGIVGHPATVSVAKESGQQTGTIVASNIQKMYNRCYGPSRPNSVWLYNQEVEPQLFKLSQPGTDNTGNFVTTWGYFFYVPPGGYSTGPYGTLMGRPCIPTQACASLSTVGDIILADFSQYLALLKSGPNPKVDVSMHLWFDQDLTAFKFSLRMGGIPWWSQVASPLNGSNTYSPFVTLATR
jgi:HK97 family phage major capsid protein